ncbi:hypothetical protein [Pseudomonas fulva]|nr:hypothetical protein [Pseudomonas fulva]MBF8778700.1 hypothetical protein [Pseudomonas fulva]
MNIAAVREQITLAHQHEARTGQLRLRLGQQLPHLHRAIELPEHDAQEILARFVGAYIDQVPELLEAANGVAREAGIQAQVLPVLRIAEAYFLQPPEQVDNQVGLDCLLDEAYLAHRLVEEVNDVYIRHFQQPLIPVDTTVANLIAHQLIGETFANQLDEVVHHSVDKLLDDEHFALESVERYRQALCSPQTGAAWQDWPSLSRQLNVELALGSRH